MCGDDWLFSESKGTSGKSKRGREGNEVGGAYEQNTRIHTYENAIVLRPILFSTKILIRKKFLRVIIEYPKSFKHFLRIIEHVNNG